MKVKLAILGAGSRGLLSYAPYALQYPDEVEIVAVAEPRQWFREKAVNDFKIKTENTFNSYQDFFLKDKMADAVIIATQDDDHKIPAITAMKKGYHVLLEKPMATTAKDCKEIVKVAKKTNSILAVCHVLRYTPYFKKIKEIIDSKVLGQITTINHQEKVGYWHYAHSYVRGNWNNEKKSSPMILAKSCHDLDILNYLIGKKCIKLSSFGSLTHFKKENMPINASKRCIDCEYSDGKCNYSAKEFYLSKLKNGNQWPLNTITQDFTKEGVLKALEKTDYGKCVYLSDNDVVDNQVLSLEYEDQITVNFSMVGTSKDSLRKTEIYASNGEISGNGSEIKLRLFNKEDQIFTPSNKTEGVDGGHLGGDEGIMRDFIKAISTNNPSYLTSGPDVSLEAHLMAFEAEKYRKA